MLTILAVAIVLVRDQLGPAGAALEPMTAAAATLGPLALCVVSTHVALWALARRVDRTGSWRALRWADRVLWLSRWAALGWHATAVFALGWLDAVRAVMGDTIVVDEVMAMLPVLAVLAAGWWSAYPLDARLRVATLFRSLEDGLPLHTPPGRGEFVWMQARHQMGLVLLGSLPLAAWSEATTRGLNWLARESAVIGPAGETALQRVCALVQTAESREWAHLGLQLVAASAAFALLPAAIGWIWDTARLGPGPLRDGLMAVCAAHGVRVRELLVWRTRGSMVNGAVLGVLGRFRYVLLTDALLERLPEVQVRAVMAHEVGHVRHRHLPWLVAGILAALGGSLTLLDGLAAAAGWSGATGPLASLVDGGLLLAGVALGMAVFGWISRRFEWQADAFAVRHLSGERRGGPGLAIDEHAVHGMVDALDAVARLNHIDPASASFRHGSVARRIARLRRLAGQNSRTLAIDRTVAGIKWASGAVLFGLAALHVIIGG